MPRARRGSWRGLSGSKLPKYSHGTRQLDTRCPDTTSVCTPLPKNSGTHGIAHRLHCCPQLSLLAATKADEIVFLTSRMARQQRRQPSGPPPPPPLPPQQQPQQQQQQPPPPTATIAPFTTAAQIPIPQPFFHPNYVPTPVYNVQLSPQDIHPQSQPQFAVPTAQQAPLPSVVPPQHARPVNAQSPENVRLLKILDSIQDLGFDSLSESLLHLFASDDTAVKQRVAPFYSSAGGIGGLMEIFMKNKKARSNGGDEVALQWASKVLKEEFETGLVKGAVNTDVRVNSNEGRGRSTGEILRDGLENFDLAAIQQKCETKAPQLWKLLEILSSSDREVRENRGSISTAGGSPANSTAEHPAQKRRKTTDTGVSIPSNAPLTVTVLLLVLASSQVRNKFQKWLGLYLYAQGMRKGPLNSLRTLGIGSEGKVICDNVLRVMSDDTRKRLRTELGGLGVGHAATLKPGARGKRKSVTAQSEAPIPAVTGPNPLENKRQFAISNITYHLTPKDHLHADNFTPCATIPFITRLPVDTPILTRSMVRTSSIYRQENFLPVTLNLRELDSFSVSAPPNMPGYYGGYTFGPGAINPDPGYHAPTTTGEYYNYMPPTSAPNTESGPSRSCGSQGADGDYLKNMLMDDESNIFWKNQIRRNIWRAMKRLWPGIGEVLAENSVDEAGTRTENRDAADPIFTFNASVQEDDFLPLPSMKRVNANNITEQLSILDSVSDYLGFEINHLKGSSGDRLWLWSSNLESVQSLKFAKSTAAPDSVLHSILPILGLFDIRQHFLHELFKMHYGVTNDKDPASLCHHMNVLNRKFLIFGFAVTGQYAEGLVLHSLESHLINSILTVTKIRQNGPSTKEEAVGIIDTVYNTYFHPSVQSHTLDPEPDEVFNNHVTFMHHAIVYSVLLTSISTAHISSLMHVLAWLAIAFQGLAVPKSSPPATRNIARELMDLVIGLKFEYSPPLSRAILHTLIHPKPARYNQPLIATHPAAAQCPGAYQESDFTMKQILRQTKTIFDLRDNPKHDFFREMITPNIRTISTVVRNAEESLGTAMRTTNQWRTPAEAVDPDREIPRLVQELRESRVAERIPGGRKVASPAENMAKMGAETLRSAAWLEEFVKWGDHGGYTSKMPVGTADAASSSAGGAATSSSGNSGHAHSHSHGHGYSKKHKNLFFNEDFAFDWGL
ncbi:hypothetical protein EDC01DRAFT_647984 [Geopyxis carbonaria]|nr:hypothetical protein EDC01DRAFT_647984 [Geopyxis carbonaria]